MSGERRTEARALVRALDPDARILALVFISSEAAAADVGGSPGDGPWSRADHGSPGAGPWSARAAAEVADAAGELRGRTLLADLTASGETLDRVLGSPDSGSPPRGLHDVALAGADVSVAAARPEDRSFLYLPRGRHPGTPGQVLGSPGLARFARRVRERRGTLLLYLPARDLPAEGLEDVLDGVVRLGEAPEGGSDPVPLPVWTLIPPPPAAPSAPRGSPSSPGAPASSGPGAPRPGVWGRHRRRGKLPVGRIAAGSLVIVALLAGWWLLARSFVPPEGGAQVFSYPVGGTDDEPTDGAAGPGLSAADSAEWAARADSSPELPFSVLIASYASRAEGRARLETLASAGGPVYFLAPTPIRGGLYYRLFAGARSDQGSAEVLMEELVEAGHKDRANPWDVRPVPLAFRLGIFGTQEELREARIRLLDQEIPTYPVPIAAAGDTAFQLFAGAYGSEEPARALEELLREAGRSPELVSRRGEQR